MIPKVIHYCWFGNHPKGDLLDRCMKSWREIMPDYEIKVWNETNSPLEISYCKDAMDKKLWSKVSNYVRLWCLHNEGGIYLDTDFEVLKSLEPLRAHDCFLGFQRKELLHVGWATNGIIGAVKGHHFLQKCMDRTLQIHQETGEFALSPHVTTQILKESGLQTYELQTIGGVTVYPTEYFYPYMWLEEYSPACIQEHTFAVHHWAGSWLK
jgi:mannosyltransferase OCH1-like enzyme